MNGLLIYISITLCASIVCAQDHEQQIHLQQFSDDHSDLADEEDDREALQENLAQTLATGYDLNTVSAEELRLLGFLSEAQIENFMAYRAELGPLLAIYELQVIPGFDREVILKMLPMVLIRDPALMISKSLLRRMMTPGHTYFVIRYGRTLEQKRGFQPRPGMPPAYAGSPDEVYMRFRCHAPGDFSIGWTGEKDAGETLSFRGPRQERGFDFSSFHVQVRRKGKLNNIILGDYQSQFAQGLLLGSAFGARKGGDVVSGIRRSHVGFLPYTGANETRLQRGIAVTLDPLKSLRLSAFFSQTRRDASPADGADSLIVRSLPATGLHRTVAEKNGRKKLGERHSGIVAEFHRSQFRAGIILEAIAYGRAIVREPTPYNRFAFRGTGNVNSGVFVSYRVANVSFFSEMARSQGGGAGGLWGLLFAPAPKLDLSLLYRHYSRDLHTFTSGSFSENSAPQNERGMYWGWKYSWSRRSDLGGYIDLFRFPWVGFRRYRPADGYEWGIRGNFLASRDKRLTVQVREECKPRNLTEIAALYRIAEGIRRQVSVLCEYGLTGDVRLGSRVQYNSYQQGHHTTEGWAVIQDISFRAGRFRFSGRHALFDTDHHDNRLYAYERDAWLAYSLPAYSGVGVRNYALIELKAHQRVTLWLRYARTRLLAGQEIGSGLDTIDGITRNDVKFQVRITY